MFKPAKARNMTTPVVLQTPSYTSVQGVNKKTYTDAETLFVNWSSYGGTELNRDDMIVIEDTAQITTWYNPNITSGARLKRDDGTKNGAIYEIIGEPENYELRNQIMSFKVRRIKGGA